MSDLIHRSDSGTPSSGWELPEIDPVFEEMLTRDILKRGILVPIFLDQDGNVIDGRVRMRIAEKHRLEVKTFQIIGQVSEADRADIRMALNAFRRHLSREQVREFIAWEVRKRPEASDRSLAGQLGVDHKTVGSVRRELEAGGEVPHAGRPARRRRQVVPQAHGRCDEQAAGGGSQGPAPGPRRPRTARSSRPPQVASDQVGAGPGAGGGPGRGRHGRGSSTSTTATSGTSATGSHRKAWTWPSATRPGRGPTCGPPSPRRRPDCSSRAASCAATRGSHTGGLDAGDRIGGAGLLVGGHGDPEGERDGPARGPDS